MNAPDFDAGAAFIAANARVIDQRRFERLFGGGAAQPVRDAVAAYRNHDGGFGHALEPDCRAPGSQALAAEMALRILDEAGAWDGALVAGICDWLAAAAPAGPGGSYTMFGVLRFLQHVPDRGRAREAFGRVGPLIIDRGLVALDPEAPGELHTPLDFAPEPASMARELFGEATIKANLDYFARAQRADGGWMFSWLAWSPAAEREWRGFLTVDALRLLRVNGYLA